MVKSTLDHLSKQKLEFYKNGAYFEDIFSAKTKFKELKDGFYL